MSRSLARVVATPSYGLTQLPDVAAHAVLVTTFVPSRFSTAMESSQLIKTTEKLGTHSRGCRKFQRLSS